MSNTSTSADVPSSADAPSLAAQMRPALVKYFRRKTRSAAEAEDLTQDVLVRALAHANWQSADQAKGYIFRIAVNLWRDRWRHLQSRGRQVEWDESTAAEAGAENPAERVLMDQEELHLVLQTLRELHPRTRTALLLVRLEQMKIANVALALGVSVRTVCSDLARAAESLARLRSSKE